ncbi:hypothetical protein [Legionella longbeachae]|uniref:Uncharacterized protein n=1 Tax=Legionella longbeachae serogroup 1 (strain NSW150) TaxID=661367 RepID=D3HK82_LEGLN|nr:hypothetical protein [Legionella longbeachae]VEE03363.1 Uncharacterised protein [Legionella oakridgensis]HBD7397640.1 hypothetical protein [Legionella pneumophila]ARB93741.1 hypothetical protein A6J40_16855 [Legionella longbeachae]ARM33119.1 hypothetical protein B0B39_06110 [Legionella longbeachae]EEZ94040.1 hypothetical protein LLB_2938 [Legionella longbeachae D-4968]
MQPLEELAQETSIDESILQTLRDLHKKINQPQDLEQPQVTNIQELLVSMIGNMEFNKELDKLGPLSAMDTGIGSLVIGSLKDVSYRTRNLNLIESDFDQIWTNFKEAQTENRELDEDEKISLSQFGILYDLANLNTTLLAFNQSGLIEGNEQLEKLFTQTQRAAEIISHLDNTFNQTFTMPSGSVVFDDTYKKSTIYGKTLSSVESTIAYAITKYGHASKGIRVGEVGDTENKVSHINPGYLQDKFALRNFLYSDVYQIKLENLIAPQQQELLKTHFGDNWQEYVEKKFHQIDRDMHDTEKTKHFHVSAEGGTYRFAQIGTSLLQGGHQNKLIRDHIDSDVRDKMMSKGDWDDYNRSNVTKMLCSEFIGMTIIATFQELNDQLKQELQEKGVEDIPKVLVQNPISEYEKMHLMTPVRLLTALQEKGSVVKVDAPDNVSKFVSNETSKTTNFREQISGLRTGSLGQSEQNEETSSKTLSK